MASELLFDSDDYMAKDDRLSFKAQGAWLQLLCLMWKSENRGELTSSLSGYASMLDCRLEDVASVVSELAKKEMVTVKFDITAGSGDIEMLLNSAADLIGHDAQLTLVCQKMRAVSRL